MTKVDQQEWALCVSVASIAPSTGMVPVKASTILAVQHRLDEWVEKAATWMASPEAAQRLQGYRDLGQQVAQAQNERDEARAEVERLRTANEELYRGTMRQAIRLAATETKP